MATTATYQAPGSQLLISGNTRGLIGWGFSLPDDAPFETIDHDGGQALRAKFNIISVTFTYSWISTDVVLWRSRSTLPTAHSQGTELERIPAGVRNGSFTITNIAKGDYLWAESGTATRIFLGRMSLSMSVTFQDKISFAGTVPNMSFTVGKAIEQFTLPEAEGNEGDVTYSLTPTLPAGVTRVGRVVSGTPTRRSDSVEYTWKAEDDENSVELKFNIVVIQGTIPTFGDGVAIQNQSWRVKDNVNFSLPIATGDDPLRYALTPAIPRSTGLRIVGRVISGRVTGTLAATEYTWTVTDIHGESNELKFTIEIRPENLIPSFSQSIPNQVWRQRQTNVNLQLPAATGGDGTLSYSIEPALPSGVSVNLSTRRVTGTPTIQAPNQEYKWIATDDDGDKAEAVFFIEVMEADVPPQLPTVPNISFFVNEDNTFTLPAGTAGNGALTYDLTGIPAGSGLSFNKNTRVLSGRPLSTRSAFELTYTVKDADNDVATETFFVSFVLRGPDVEPTFPQGTTIADQAWEQGVSIGTVTLPAADSGNEPLNYTLTPTLPAGVSFNASRRQLTGTPTAFFTSTTFTYTVTDADGDTASLQFDINVREPDLIPTWAPGASIADLVLTTGTRMAGIQLPAGRGGNGTLQYSLTPDLPAGITFDPATRLLMGTPTFILARTQYTYTARDRDGDTISLRFHITVPDTQPRFASRPINQSWRSHTPVPRFILPEAVGGNVPYTYELDTLPPTGTVFNPVTREISGTPTETQTPVEYTYTATDVDGDTVSLRFSITVPDTAPSFGANTIPDQVLNRNHSVNIQLPFATGGNGQHTHSLSPDLPAGMAINVNTGRITGTPSVFFPRTLFSWTGTDADGDSVSLDFYLSIPNLVPTFPSGTVIPDQTWETGVPIRAVVLPQGSGGNGQLQYTLFPALPDGINLDLTRRRLSGASGAILPRTQYTWRVVDEDGSSSALRFFIEIPNRFPTFNPSLARRDVVLTAGETFRSSPLPTATGGNIPLEYSISPGLPAGISFDTNTRELFGRPTSLFQRAEYSLVATDVNGDRSIYRFDLSVVGKPIVFSVTSLPVQRWQQNRAVELVLPAATGGDGGSISYSFVFQPPLSGIAFIESERKLTGIPSKSGTYRGRYTASDSSGSSRSMEIVFVVVSEPQPTYEAFQPLTSKGRVNYLSQATVVTERTTDPTPEPEGADTSKPTATTGFVAFGLVKQIRMDWDNVADTFTSFKRWELQVNDTGTGARETWYALKNDGQDPIGQINEVTPVVTNYYVHIVTTDDKTLYYRIRPVNESGIAGDWVTARATTLESGETIDQTKPAVPTGFTGDGRYRENFLDWDYVSGLAFWELQVSENRSVWYSLRNDGRGFLKARDENSNVPTNSYRHNVQADNKTLYYRLRAVSKASKESEWTDPIAVTTEDAEGVTTDLRTPGVPTGFQAHGLYRLIRIDWNNAPEPPAVEVSHWELQVSRGSNGPWYELNNNGDDWKTGAAWSSSSDRSGWTEVRGQNYYTHFAIPVPRRGSAATEITLYYRLRAVTHAGIKSNWTSPAQAMASGITQGQLVQGIVDAYLVDPENYLKGFDVGLRAWYPMDDTGGDGRTMTDISGNGYNATYGRTPGVIDGTAGKAIDFYSTSYRAFRGSSLGSSMRACTISMMVRVDSSGVLCNLGIGTSGIQLTCTTRSFSAIVGRARISAARPGAAILGWWHVCLTWGGGSDISLWVNGIEVDTVTGSSGPSSINPSQMTLGQFNGAIDEVRIYSRKLDVGEVRFLTLFPAGPTPGMIIGDRIVAKSINADKVETDFFATLIALTQSQVFVTPTGFRLEDRVVSSGDIETVIDNDEIRQRRATRNNPPLGAGQTSGWEIINQLLATGREGRLQMWDRVRNFRMVFNRDGILVDGPGSQIVKLEEDRLEMRASNGRYVILTPDGLQGWKSNNDRFQLGQSQGLYISDESGRTVYRLRAEPIAGGLILETIVSGVISQSLNLTTRSIVLRGRDQFLISGAPFKATNGIRPNSRLNTRSPTQSGIYNFLSPVLPTSGSTNGVLVFGAFQWSFTGGHDHAQAIYAWRVSRTQLGIDVMDPERGVERLTITSTNRTSRTSSNLGSVTIDEMHLAW